MDQSDWVIRDTLRFSWRRLYCSGSHRSEKNHTGTRKVKVPARRDPKWKNELQQNCFSKISLNYLINTRGLLGVLHRVVLEQASQKIGVDPKLFGDLRVHSTGF
jgi:hypothetical protein